MANERLTGKKRWLAKFAKVVALVVLLGAGVWSYWPTLLSLVERWLHVPDYSHGFLIIPFALLLLFLRRATRPALSNAGRFWSIPLMVVAVLLRFTSARMFLPSLDGWTIPLWLAAISLWWGGWPFLKWCTPSLAFLLFMVPLPFRAESMLSAPLRDVAAGSTVYLLHSLGQPAILEGTLINVGDHQFDVARQCSGLRMLFSVLAFAFAYLTLTEVPWWKKLILGLLAVPIAIMANVIRVTSMAFVIKSTESETVVKWTHDSAGWLTFLVGGTIFFICVWCLNRTFLEIEDEPPHPLLFEANQMPAMTANRRNR